MEYFKSYLITVDYVLPFPFICLFGGYLEAFIRTRRPLNHSYSTIYVANLSLVRIKRNIQ